MKFKLKQEKFQELLEKLVVKDIFPSCVITTKEGKLFSIQKEEHGRALRFVKFNKSYFKEISDTIESIEIDVSRVLTVIKNIPANTTLEIETVGNKLSVKKLVLDKDGKVTGEKGYTRISFKEPDEKIVEKLPFEIKDGVPLIGDEKLPLKVLLTVDLADFKSLSKFAGSLKTEFYQFHVKDKKISVRVGDLHDFSDYHTEYMEGSIDAGESLEVTLSYGLVEIADTFRQDNIKINTNNNAPVWVHEKSEKYELAVLIPPFIETE